MKLESKVFSERLHGRWARDKYTERKKQLNKTFKEKKIHPFLDGYHYCHSNLNVVSPLHVMPGSRFWGSESYQKWGNTNVKYRLNNHNIADQHKPGNPDKTNTFYCIGGGGSSRHRDPDSAILQSVWIHEKEVPYLNKAKISRIKHKKLNISDQNKI